MPNILQQNKENALELKEKRISYKNYIKEHKASVITAYKKFKSFMSRPDIHITLSNEELKCLEDAVMKHDDSKLSKIEFEAYRKHFFPCSFEKEEKEEKENFKNAKLHHYQSNDHHPQNESRRVGLNKVACIHNILDWIAMSYKFNDKVWEYYNSSKFKDILNPLEREYIEQILDIIRLNETYFYGEAKNEPDKIEER